MGETVTIGESLIITVFSMAVVFVVLVAISYLINILRATTNDKKEQVQQENTKTIVQEETKKEEEIDENLDNEELVAVIAAAISANMGLSIPDINIKAIRRVSQNSSIWSDTGRREQVIDNL